MYPDLSSQAEQSAKAFQALQASLAALEREEARQKVREGLVGFLAGSKRLLEIALSLIQEKGSIKAVEYAITQVEWCATNLRAVVALRPTALQEHPDLAPHWSPALDQWYRAMIQTYDRGLEDLRKYESNKKAVRDVTRSPEFRRQMLDVLLSVGSEDEQAETWDELRRGLDEERPTGRKLFPPE